MGRWRRAFFPLAIAQSGTTFVYAVANNPMSREWRNYIAVVVDKVVSRTSCTPFSLDVRGQKTGY